MSIETSVGTMQHKLPGMHEVSIPDIGRPNLGLGEEQVV